MNLSPLPTRRVNMNRRSPVRDASPNNHNHASHQTAHARNLHLNVNNPSPRRVRRNTGSDSVNAEAANPLIEVENATPTLAAPETDTELDDREVVNAPYPGVDDGFFTNGNGGNPQEAENIPIMPRAGGDGNGTTNTKPVDATPIDNPNMGGGGFVPNNATPFPPSSPFPNPRIPDNVPFNPDIHIPMKPDSNFPDFVDNGTFIPEESIPDVNVYQHKKTLAQGMMDLALFSANANQLRYVLESFDRHPYYYPSIVLITFSLLIQVGVGVGLIWNSRYNINDIRERCLANKVNNFTVIGIFLVTVVNVFVSAFGVANNPSIIVPVVPVIPSAPLAVAPST